MTTATTSSQLGWSERLLTSIMQSMDTKTFSAKEKILFYKQLVYMLKGGVAILQAVDTIKKSSTNYALKKVATSIMFHLNEGKSFSYALLRLPEYFDESDAAIIKTGESTGNLDIVLQELANEYSYLNTIKNRYRSALTYPIILIIMAVGAVLFLFSSVLPNILDMVA
ncbi:MAG: type II secretion system F family protein [bacterium]|nr:type II secretion system F family protein [bacterium]